MIFITFITLGWNVKCHHFLFDLRGAHARVFGINNKGEIFIRDMKYMNGTEAHIVVVAEDSGIPPRRASVPVVVMFDQEKKSLSE